MLLYRRRCSHDAFGSCGIAWKSPGGEGHKDLAEEPRNIDGMPVYFHYLTLMALHCYLDAGVGTAVIECGIGGEYDTTNILERPLTTGITSLGIDHEAMLGDTIEDIAWHKSGIFKPGAPAFTAPQPEAALVVLQERAKERNAELYTVPEHPGLRAPEAGLAR